MYELTGLRQVCGTTAFLSRCRLLDGTSPCLSAITPILFGSTREMVVKDTKLKNDK
jgi:hypothetical protein